MKNNLTLFFFLLCLNIVCTPIIAQNQTQAFDKILTNFFEDKNGPGGTAIVVKDGKTIYKKAFGKAHLELDVNMQTDHIFRIGSITKQFTACAILKLKEEGKLDLQDELTKYIADYPTNGKKITIEHLLTHTSGIKSYTGMDKFDSKNQKIDLTLTEMVDFFKDEPMDFEPGEDFRYNNSGYFLLGYIIEKVSGKTYQTYIEETFFKPLGMKNSFYDNSNQIIKNRAAGFQKGENGYENADYLSMKLPYAAGSLMSNLADLSRWYHAVNEGKVISKESLAKAHNAYKLNNGKPVDYGYGWFLGNVQGNQMYQHGGGINGFLTASLFIPEDKVFVAVFSNCTCNGPHQTAIKLAAEAIGKPYNYKKIKLPKETLQDYVAVYESEDGQGVVSLEKGQLFSMVTGGSKTPIFPFAKDKFFFENSFMTLEFQRNEKGEIKSILQKSVSLNPTTWQRTDKPLPTIKPIEIPKEALAKYIGKYQLAFDFFIKIRQEGNKLIAQATRQPSIDLIPIAEHKFTLTDVDAQLLFHFDEEGKVTHLTLFQGGEHEAKKVE